MPSHMRSSSWGVQVERVRGARRGQAATMQQLLWGPKDASSTCSAQQPADGNVDVAQRVTMMQSKIKSTNPQQQGFKDYHCSSSRTLTCIFNSFCLMTNYVITHLLSNFSNLHVLVIGSAESGRKDGRAKTERGGRDKGRLHKTLCCCCCCCADRVRAREAPGGAPIAGACVTKWLCACYGGGGER